MNKIIVSNIDRIEIPLIHKLILSREGRVIINDIRVNIVSVRLKLFARKGTTCICCKTQASHYKIDGIEQNQTHLNLYAIRNNKRLLMTKDHEECRSHGGNNNLDNMNPMCTVCNHLRGNQYELRDFIELYHHGHFEKRKNRMELKILKPITTHSSEISPQSSALY